MLMKNEWFPDHVGGEISVLTSAQHEWRIEIPRQHGQRSTFSNFHDNPTRRARHIYLHRSDNWRTN